MRTFLFFFALLAAGGLAAAELELSNGLIDLRVDGGRIALSPAGARKPSAIIAPAFKGGPVKVFVVDRRNSKCRIVRLSTPQSSIAFELHDNYPFVRMALNRNASPVRVTAVAGIEATVIPDPFAEDAMFLPGKALRLSARVPGYLMMLKDGATLSCLPMGARDDALLSADFATLTLSQRNTEEYTFVLNAGAWTKTTIPELGKRKTVDGWKAPFPALWQASFAVGLGFLPLGDGLRCNWNVAIFDGKRFRNAVNRFIIMKIESFFGGTGGFEGSFRYPAVVRADGVLEISNPLFSNGPRQRYDTAKPLYIYAFYGEDQRYDMHRAYSVEPYWGGDPRKRAPGYFMEPWMRSRIHWRATSFATTPTTCATTASFEKIFRNEKGAEKKNEIIQMLASMQCFVEGIRGRIENARVWGSVMREFAAAAVKADPSLEAAAKQLDAMLDNFETLYEQALPVIRQPAAVEKLSAEVIALTTSASDPEEIEGRAKRLGSAIRTIGGSQDRLTARMRYVGKCVRQHAILNRAVAATPAERSFWSEVYRRSEEMLQSFYGHDGK